MKKYKIFLKISVVSLLVLLVFIPFNLSDQTVIEPAQTDPIQPVSISNDSSPVDFSPIHDKSKGREIEISGWKGVEFSPNETYGSAVQLLPNYKIEEKPSITPLPSK